MPPDHTRSHQITPHPIRSHQTPQNRTRSHQISPDPTNPRSRIPNPKAHQIAALSEKLPTQQHLDVPRQENCTQYKRLGLPWTKIADSIRACVLLHFRHYTIQRIPTTLNDKLYNGEWHLKTRPPSMSYSAIFVVCSSSKGGTSGWGSAQSALPPYAVLLRCCPATWFHICLIFAVTIRSCESHRIAM